MAAEMSWVSLTTTKEAHLSGTDLHSKSWYQLTCKELFMTVSLANKIQRRQCNVMTRPEDGKWSYRKLTTYPTYSETASLCTASGGLDQARKTVRTTSHTEWTPSLQIELVFV